LGVVIQRPSKLLDRAVQASFKIDKHVVSPEALAKFLAGHKFAWSFQQENQDL
jgi:hypothetical protein